MRHETDCCYSYLLSMDYCLIEYEIQSLIALEELKALLLSIRLQSDYLTFTSHFIPVPSVWSL